MKTKAENVFLFSGIKSTSRPASGRAPGPLMEQRVVIAPDEATAYKHLAEKEPGYRPLGAANLKDYEDAAANLRAVLKGTKKDWPLLVAM